MIDSVVMLMVVWYVGDCCGYFGVENNGLRLKRVASWIVRLEN